MIKVSTDGLENKRNMYEAAAINALEQIKNESCRGNDFLGWKKLPEYSESQEYKRLVECAEKVRKDADILIVIGIGGSYLGARAGIEFLLSHRYNETAEKRPRIYFSGNGIDADDLQQLLDLCEGKSVYVNVISKSGTTLEPALSFRIFREYLEKRYGRENAAKRIIATTDEKKGVLRELACRQGYECFIIPDDVGGRYSVLSAVGLFPMECAGINSSAILEGSRQAKAYCFDEQGPAVKYAAARQLLYESGKKTEILSCSSENVRFFSEWFKQLFGESEGKEGKGIFPASCIYTADLHSMGQYIQEGERTLFETMLYFKESRTKITAVHTADNDVDGLNYLNGKDFDEIYECARLGVKQAHIDGGVPVIEISAACRDERTLGELFFFFETACAISAIMSGVNPFNQEGVESYKKNMFRLLGR